VVVVVAVVTRLRLSTADRFHRNDEFCGGVIAAVASPLESTNHELQIEQRNSVVTLGTQREHIKQNNGILKEN